MATKLTDSQVITMTLKLMRAIIALQAAIAQCVPADGSEKSTEAWRRLSDVSKSVDEVIGILEGT
ncbi:MAG: hypothetical protein ABSE20_08140 [Acetobacteraceae bacterium]|jgi:hypothetical protein